jgi:hypothetical protein
MPNVAAETGTVKTGTSSRASMATASDSPVRKITA